MKINFNIYNTYNKNYKKGREEKYKPFSAPLKYDTFEYSYPLSFMAQCSPQAFKVKNIPDLHCPVCGLLMLTHEQKSEFVSDVYNKTGESLIKALEKYEDESVFCKDAKKNKHRTIYRPIKKEIVDEIKELARENPTLKLDKLVQLKAQTSINSLIDTQLEIVSELEDYINENVKSPDELNGLKSTILIYKNQILGNAPVRFERKKFIYALSIIVSDKPTRDEIIRIISKLPASSTDVDSFFVKYSQGTTSKEIASKFVYQSGPSTEHLVPRSKSGKNNTSNYICDCADCNSLRSNVDFDVWMETIDNFEENLQEYLNDIQSALDREELSTDYRNYIDEIIPTLKTLSKGKMNFYRPESSNALERERNYEKRKETFYKIINILKNYKNKKEELQKKILALREYPYYDIIIKHSKTNIQIASLERKIAQLENTNKNLRFNISTNYQDEFNDKLKEIEKNDEQIMHYEAELAFLKLEQERIELNTPCFRELDEKIALQKEFINELDILREKINSLQKEVADYDAILVQKNELREQNKLLKFQNSKILSKNNFDTHDYSDYIKMKHYYQLKKTADDLLTESDKKRNKNAIDYHAELIEMARVVVDKRLRTLLNSEKVHYFENKDTIKANERKIIDINKKINEMLATKQIIASLEEQIIKKTNGIGYEGVLEEYNKLLDEKASIDLIVNISDLESELKSLEEILDYNQEIVKKLAPYKTMTNEEFENLIKEIYLKEFT